MKATGSSLVKVKTVKSKEKSVDVYMDVDTMKMYLLVNNDFISVSQEELKKLEESATRS
jgi:hypothetical protein